MIPDPLILNNSKPDFITLSDRPRQQQTQGYNFAIDRPRRTHKATIRYGFKDASAFVLLTSCGEPSFDEAISSSAKDKWMSAMVEKCWHIGIIIYDLYII